MRMKRTCVPPEVARDSGGVIDQLRRRKAADLVLCHEARGRELGPTMPEPLETGARNRGVADKCARSGVPLARANYARDRLTLVVKSNVARCQVPLL